MIKVKVMDIKNHHVVAWICTRQGCTGNGGSLEDAMGHVEATGHTVLHEQRASRIATIGPDGGAGELAPPVLDTSG